MRISAVKGKVIIDRHKETKKDVILVGDDDVSIAKVVSSYDKDLRDTRIAFYTINSTPLGNEFPSTYEVIPIEDVIGIVTEEED